MGLTIPAHIARQIGDQEGRFFVCELTNEGILFRPAEDAKVTKPKWADR